MFFILPQKQHPHKYVNSNLVTFFILSKMLHDGHFSALTQVKSPGSVLTPLACAGLTLAEAVWHQDDALMLLAVRDIILLAPDTRGAIQDPMLVLAALVYLDASVYVVGSDRVTIQCVCNVRRW